MTILALSPGSGSAGGRSGWRSGQQAARPRSAARPATGPWHRSGGDRTRPGLRASSARVGLTRNGRLVRTLAMTCLAAAGLAATWDGGPGVAARPLESAGPAARTLPPDTVTVTVAPGETLWHVARRTAPQQDPRDVVTRLVLLNGLTGARVRAGQELIVPAHPSAKMSVDRP